MPGHWEGDLLIGKRNQTAIGTLVERATGFAMLVALPDGYKPEHVAPALARKVQTLPDALRRSLTWDQGPEMRDWKQIRLDAGIDVFFCDPHAPWQRGSNENTNGLLRQYFPKGFDFSTVTEAELDAVADELNDRPRKRFAFANPDRAALRPAVAITARIRRSACGTRRSRGRFRSLTAEDDQTFVSEKTPSRTSRWKRAGGPSHHRSPAASGRGSTRLTWAPVRPK